MSYRPLELKIQSAQGLKYVNHLTKMKPYAEVFIRDSNNILHSPAKKTSVDSKGGSNPTWDCNVQFTIDLAMAQNNLDLVVKLKSRRKTHGLRDKEIGEVKVPISELLIGFDDDDDDDAAEDRKHMTKDIEIGNGETQGTLAFSYKFGRTVDRPPTNPNGRPGRGTGTNGFVRGFAEGLGEGMGTGLMSMAGSMMGDVFSRPNDDNDQPRDDDDDNEQ